MGNELKRLWIAQQTAAGAALLDPLPAARVALRSELAGVLGSLLRIANDAKIDLEEAYIETMGSD